MRIMQRFWGSDLILEVVHVSLLKSSDTLGLQNRSAKTHLTHVRAHALLKSRIPQWLLHCQLAKLGGGNSAVERTWLAILGRLACSQSAKEDLEVWIEA